MRLTCASLAALVAITGCAPEFDPYNQVLGFRVLGLRAEPPQLQPEQAATVDALVTGAAATYQWSWCPVPGAPGQCAITEDELRALAAEAGFDPEALPAYDLGSEPTAVFAHTIDPELLAGVCAAIAGAELPEGAPRPECAGSFDVELRLEVSDGAETIVGVRSLGLIYDEAVEVANANPQLGGAEIVLVGGDVRMPMGNGEVPTVARSAVYTVEVAVSEAEAELYEESQDGEPVTRRETLTISWFFEAGEMKKMRSSFLEGTTTLENLRQNEWTAPEAEEAVDRNRFYFVLRDDRGGLDFAAGEVALR